ncbi:MAG: molybdopterin-dependent oxidoreductase [Clostridiales Family XIII bacterium]|jgi:trimethylamine-N-oxide reductase (cytochrome c)|nr:molybdopterin-dependent oxidoreductase [Clostridiales Family XIII bacterium]
MGKIVRKTQGSTGGSVFVDVDVDENKIVRVYPMDLTDEDPSSWVIKARGREFSPKRRTAINEYTTGFKATVHSDKRVLYPLKRIGFDPDGDRHLGERGEPRPGGDPLYPGYERISWDEATDLVANEIIRVKREYGPGAIVGASSSHHMWGNIGYRHSALFRFMNLVGIVYADHNPDSWEGWYWGGMQSWGSSNRLGLPEQWDLLEDCLQNCEMLVFWASDPETTAGCYGGFESTQRRRWMKELGIKMVFIDPFYNHTAALLSDKWFSPRLGTDAALAAAILYQWLEDDTYDHWFVENRVTGFEEFCAYLRGETDGVPKTPEWAAEECRLEAPEIRKLAREWASHKTMLAAGGIGGWGGACRSPSGMEWARMMIALMAFQGLGKPGVNIFSTTEGTPTDPGFYFPGYGEGGISGDPDNSGMLFRLAYKMFDGVTSMPAGSNINVASAVHIPRLRIPECVMDDYVEWRGKGAGGGALEHQFHKYHYPADGYARIQLYYKYGNSYMGTMSETNRYAKMYRSERLPMVVNQAIWFEGETQFADVILPACTNFERWDISEWANCGGYGACSETIPNHRIITLQQKCIEPLGESKSDYEIFRAVCDKLGLGGPYSEGKDELDWCKQLFHATDLPKLTTWEEFLERGYVVVPDNPDRKKTPGHRWFYEGREMDTPGSTRFHPSTQIGFKGLQTQTGKIELVSTSLQRFYDTSGEVDEQRPVLTQYIPSREGHRAERFKTYPLALLSPHPRHSFHTMADNKDGFMLDIKDHRVWKDGFPYWIIRINKQDADARGIKEGDLVRAFNERGAVVLCAQITERVPAGTVHSYMACSDYKPTGKPGESTDRAGCVNILSSREFMSKTACGMATAHNLIQVEKWEGGNAIE